MMKMKNKIIYIIFIYFLGSSCYGDTKLKQKFPKNKVGKGYINLSEKIVLG